MALNRGQELTRGVRGTQLENAFGVVKTSSASLGQIGGKLAETAEKITLFQADIMDKEWQNNFDKNSSIFIAEETRKELNSTNPDIVGLQQKLLSYKDKTLQEAPQRFSNYVTNKLDISFAENINLVKDYSNDLKFTNLYSETTELQGNIVDQTSNYFDQVIKNNPGDLEKINSLFEQHFLNVVTPNINRVAKNYESLNKLQPLKFTPTDISSGVRKLQIDFTSEKFIGKMKGIIGSIDFENNTADKTSMELTEANKVIDDLIQEFVINPESREISNLSDEEVESIRLRYNKEKERLLNLENEKVKKSEIATDNIISQKASFVESIYANNAQVAINANLNSVVELVAQDDYLYRDPGLAAKTIENSMRAINIHKALNQIKLDNGGILPNSDPTLIDLIKNKTGVELDKNELNKFRYAMIGTSPLTVNEYMDIVNESTNNPNYGEQGDGKSISQVNQERSNLIDKSVFEYQLKNGVYPPDTANNFAGVDAILTKDPGSINSTDIKNINNAFGFYRISKGQNPNALYEQGFGEISDFFQYLDKTRGELYTNIITTDIESMRGLLKEYRDNLKSGFDFGKANQYVIDNELTYATTQVIEDKIVEDARTQYGGKALLNYLRNKLPTVEIGGYNIVPFALKEGDKKKKTSSYTDLFGVTEFEKFSIGMTKPLFYESKGYKEARSKIIDVPPNIEAQLNNIYVLELNKLVDFNKIGNDDITLQKQIKENQELALDLTVRKLRDQGFGVSKYEKKGEGLTLTYQPLDDKIPYDNPEDKDMYIAVHFFNRIREMETKYGVSYMKEFYPNLYFTNFGTDQENEVSFDLNRAYDLGIEQDGIFLTREPGTDVYRYNLDPEIFNAPTTRLELDGDIDEEQYFRPDRAIVLGDQLISNEAIIGNAIDKYLDQSSEVEMFNQLGIDREIIKNIFYTVYYPGVKMMTSEDEILDYLEKQTVNPYGLIK